MLALFNIEWVVHYGTAGNVNPSSLNTADVYCQKKKENTADVTIPQYWSHTFLWNWQVSFHFPERQIKLRKFHFWIKRNQFRKMFNVIAEVWRWTLRWARPWIKWRLHQGNWALEFCKLYKKSDYLPWQLVEQYLVSARGHFSSRCNSWAKTAYLLGSCWFQLLQNFSNSTGNIVLFCFLYSCSKL